VSDSASEAGIATCGSDLAKATPEYAGLGVGTRRLQAIVPRRPARSARIVSGPCHFGEARIEPLRLQNRWHWPRWED